MTTLKKYTAVLASMIIAVVALPSTANASGIHLKVSNTFVSIGSNGHYGNSYNTKKVYANNNRNRNRFSKTSNNTSKYYTNSRNSNKRIVTTKKIVTSNNSFNRNSKTIVRKTRIIR